MENLHKKIDPSVPKKIAHIGIAVENLEEAMAFYEKSLGVSAESIEKVPMDHVEVAFLKVGETMLELIQPLNEKSPVFTFIQKRGQGIHHIAFEIEDLQRRIDILQNEGIRMIDNSPRRGAGGHDVAFAHPSSSYGVLLEYVQSQHRGEL
ncbi:methylmalonyl-CoA epimerase [Halobacillus yeomjeoni]|uniref:methylmalonyl-CoA epimerase n=1 Tax=Halobacillus yeomjeoni TaxID=311194 RepID=UPI001CD586F7|nr:methylmalonyl-CoA epimerase [Halobacillus yeomjeoni]MCA0982824.1 methylmalonyl-CoA epimerase [Halobacillus yeomjeoni]